MKTPEKIWINPSMDLPKLNGVIDKDSIQYVRKDAFIEKAEKFFTEKFEVEDYNDNIDVDGSPIFNYCRFIEDFKKYMEEN